MLKISGLLLLIYGLLTPTSAQVPLSHVSHVSRVSHVSHVSSQSSQLAQATQETQVSNKINNVLSQQSLNTELASGIQSMAQNALVGIISKATQGLNSLAGGLFGFGNIIDIQVKDLQLLKVSLKPDPSSPGMMLMIPAEFSVSVTVPILGSMMINVRANMGMQVEVIRGMDNLYHLQLTNCRLLPESLDIKTKAPLGLNTVVDAAESALKSVFATGLGSMMCPALNAFLQTLDQQVLGAIFSMTGKFPLPA